MHRILRDYGTIRLSVVMSALFVLLSIPVLIFILLYNYYKNASAIEATLTDEVAKTKQVSIEEVENLFSPVAATLRMLAAVAAQNPDAFKKNQSRDFRTSGFRRTANSLVAASRFDLAKGVADAGNINFGVGCGAKVHDAGLHGRLRRGK